MSTSPLLNLPGELREAIYKATLIQSEPIRLCERSDNASEAARGVHLSLHQAREPALLLACHQIRDEALHIFYRDNVFFSGTQNTLEVWLKAIGPDRAQLLKTIRGFRHSVYFNCAWGKLLVRKIERELMFKGCPLREGVLHMPFGHYSYPELVFWTNGLEDVVEATKAGVVEHTRERYMVIANGDETDLNDVEKQSPVLKKLYGRVLAGHGSGTDAKDL